MTPDEIEKMKADIEAGTPGPWSVDNEGDVTAALGYVVADMLAPEGIAASAADTANARRIARVPQLEAEVLRLRDALIHINSMDPEHYRIDSFSGESLRGIVLEMGMQARAALNGGTDD